MHFETTHAWRSISDKRFIVEKEQVLGPSHVHKTSSEKKINQFLFQLEERRWLLLNVAGWAGQLGHAHYVTLHNGGARGHFNFSQFWDLLTRCINFYSHSLIFPAILPPLIVYNLFIWWYRWVSGEEYYHFLYFAFSVAQTVQKLQVSCFFRSVNGSRESHYTLQHP